MVYILQEHFNISSLSVVKGWLDDVPKIKKRAIVLFEPNNEIYLEIFNQFIFNSWQYLLRVEQHYKYKYNLNFTNIIDLIVVLPSHFDLYHLLPNECSLINNLSHNKQMYLYNNLKRIRSQCLVISTNDNQRKLFQNNEYYKYLLNERYTFLNSIDCIITFKNQYPNLYSWYDYILRTDDDIFFTPFFLYTFPKNSDEFIVGRGGFVWSGYDITRNHLINVSSIFGINHCRYPDKFCFNYGSTWYGSSDLIYKVSELTINITTYLIQQFDTNKFDVNNWEKGWFCGVSLLYASEIAVHGIINNDKSKSIKTPFYHPNYINMDSGSTIRGYINNDNSIIHIHCWHTDDIFSKFKWKNDEHKNMYHQLTNSLLNNKLEIRMYCLLIAYNYQLPPTLFNIDEILFEKGFIGNQIT